MKLGITGLSLSGKTTIFEALTQAEHDPAKKGENRIATITVPDERIDVLSKMYNPKKTIYAKIEYFLPGNLSHTDDKAKDALSWNAVRDCDALIHVVRNFALPGYEAPNIEKDFQKLDEELTFTDLIVVEKRIERLELDKKRNRDYNAEEHELLLKCKEMLESETPLRYEPELARDPLLKGFAFLSGRPMLVIINNDDDNDEIPNLPEAIKKERTIMLRGKLEHEISQMEEEDASAFMEEFGIQESGMNRAIRESYDLLGLMSFFTVGEDEVRAWTIEKDTEAVDSAETIHSDIKKGFIRAEVLAYNDLMNAGSYAEARKKGTVRLEGKNYIVKDADIINFRFNV